MMPPEVEIAYYPQLGKLLNDLIGRRFKNFKEYFNPPTPTLDDLDSVRFIKDQWESRSDYWTDPKQHFVLSGSGEQKAAIKNSLAKYLPPDFCQGQLLDLGSGGLPQAYLTQDALSALTALDLSEKALQKNQAYRRTVADANQALPFRDEAFDFIFMFFLTRYLKNQNYTIQEAIRLLKPGGRILVLDNLLRWHPLERGFFMPSYLEGYPSLNALESVEVLKILDHGIHGKGLVRFAEPSIYMFTGVKPDIKNNPTHRFNKQILPSRMV